VIHVKQPVAVEPIYFPKNYDEVIKYLKTLSSDQLQYISKSLVSILNDRLMGALHDQKTRVEQQTRDMLKRA